MPKYIFITFITLLMISCQNTPKPSPLVPPLPKVPTPKEDLGKFGFKQGIQPSENPIQKAEQLIIVIAPNDKSTSGTLYLFEKKNKEWERVKNMDCSLGKHGMAWGSGLLDQRVKRGYRKQEGDGKTPAGIFDFGAAFGYVPKENANFISFPYIESYHDYFCVDDVDSEFYNQIVSTQDVKKDWKGGENMNRKDHLYEWGIFVQHNTPAQANDGSCIHLHVWRDKGKYTAGCTAVARENMMQILAWLSPNKNPKLVQITKAAYPQLATWFELPTDVMQENKY